MMKKALLLAGVAAASADHARPFAATNDPCTQFTNKQCAEKPVSYHCEVGQSNDWWLKFYPVSRCMAKPYADVVTRVDGESSGDERKNYVHNTMREANEHCSAMMYANDCQALSSVSELYNCVWDVSTWSCRHADVPIHFREKVRDVGCTLDIKITEDAELIEGWDCDGDGHFNEWVYQGYDMTMNSLFMTFNFFSNDYVGAETDYTWLNDPTGGNTHMYCYLMEDAGEGLVNIYSGYERNADGECAGELGSITVKSKMNQSELIMKIMSMVTRTGLQVKGENHLG